LETQLLRKQLIPRSSIDEGGKLMIDEEAEEKTKGSGELAPDKLDLMLGLFGREGEELRSSFLALALAFAFSTTALLSSRKAKSTMFR
jgi:hypothetical protein